MLPFLRKKQESSVTAPAEVIERKPDEGSESLDMLDAVSEDLIDAVHKKDKKLLKSVLEALIEHIQAADEKQDESINQ